MNTVSRLVSVSSAIYLLERSSDGIAWRVLASVQRDSLKAAERAFAGLRNPAALERISVLGGVPATAGARMAAGRPLSIPRAELEAAAGLRSFPASSSPSSIRTSGSYRTPEQFPHS